MMNDTITCGKPVYYAEGETCAYGIWLPCGIEKDHEGRCGVRLEVAKHLGEERENYIAGRKFWENVLLAAIENKEPNPTAVASRALVDWRQLFKVYP